jgi:hypothetical protein
MQFSVKQMLMAVAFLAMAFGAIALGQRIHKPAGSLLETMIVEFRLPVAIASLGGAVALLMGRVVPGVVAALAMIVWSLL